MRRLMLITVKTLTIMLLLGVGIFVGLLSSSFTKLDDLEVKANERSTPGVILARDNKTKLRTLRAPTSRTYLEEKDLPTVLTQAVISAEDRRFFQHSGVDLQGLFRAALTDIKARGAVEGGSTITQQLVKNTYVGPKKSIARKTREAIYAIALETRWSKRHILTTYLNTAYFGNGNYGVVDASRGYFSKYPKKLTYAEAALLAALLRSPEGINPMSFPVAAKKHRDQVLTTMNSLGYIDDKQLQFALSSALPTPAQINRLNRTSKEIAPHFSDAVSSELIRHFGIRRALGSSLRVKTTLDAGMQKSANKALVRVDSLGLDAALIAIDVKSGEVRAMANGGKAKRSAFNISMDGHRQPGSAFKPFMLAAAYNTGLTPSYKIKSAPFSKDYPGGKFKVKNDGGYSGLTTLERATWKSDNTVFARLQDQIGIGKAIDMARNAGIRSQIDDVPATVLGALPYGTTPAEMALAYSTFARHGKRISLAGSGTPRIISIVGVKDTKERWRPLATQKQAIDQGVADLVTATLEGVIKYGTGTAASIGRSAAGKTGTTENYQDAWFVGYTPDLVTAVWVGHIQGAIPMRTENNGAAVTGGSIPAAIWRDFMLAASSQNKDKFSLDIPRYKTVLVDPKTNLLAGIWCKSGVEKRFLEGKEPTSESLTCTDAKRKTPDVTGMTLDEAEAIFIEQGFTLDPVIEKQLVTNEKEDGIVIKQIPEAGSEITHDSLTHLVVAYSVFSEN